MNGSLFLSLVGLVGFTVMVGVLSATQQKRTLPPANSESAEWLRTRASVRSIDGKGNAPLDAGCAGVELAHAMTTATCAERLEVPQEQVMRLFDPQENAYERPPSQLSSMAWLWGQFLDHTLTATGDSSTVNQLSSFVDASSVYGHTAQVLASLRDPHDPALMLLNGTVLPGWPRMHAGDERRDVHAGLLAMHTVWVREHNRLVGELRAAHPALTPSELFEGARRRVVAQIQAVTVEEWVPAVFGHRLYGLEYDMNADATVTTEWSTVCFRFGHSMVTQHLGTLELTDSFVRANDILREPGATGRLLGDTWATPSEPVDLRVAEAMRTTPLFRLPMLNVERGRQRCLPSYGELLEHFYLPAPQTWAQVTGGHAPLDALLADVYGADPTSPRVDAFVGALAEAPSRPGSAAGALVDRCVTEQLRRSVVGDAYYYRWTPLPAWDSLQAVASTTAPLGAIVARNTQGNDGMAQAQTVFARKS